MSSSPRHPAFYASRRQLWSTLPGSKPKCAHRCFRHSGLGTNCDSLLDVWYTLFLIFSTLWLILLGVWRYREFKAQAYDPRYGSAWNETGTLHVQLSALILSVALFPMILYASVSHTGHLANDAVTLGRDLLHLQHSLSTGTVAHRLWKPSNSGGIPNQTSVEPPATGHRPRGTSVGDEELDTLLLKRRGEDCQARVLHSLRPFSTVLYVLLAYALLFPVCVLEAEQLRNEAIDPIYVLHSNLDGIFGAPSLTDRLKEARVRSDLELRVEHQNERPFPGHTYPVTPSQVSWEFAVFAISLCFLTVRYAMPFYFTSRVFSSVFSAFIALTSLFLLIDTATIAVVYKLFSVGVREPGGAVLLELSAKEQVLTPWQCVCLSAAGLPAILVNLMAIYAYGEEQFSRAVINYAQLLIAGDLPPSRSARIGDPNKLRCNGGLGMECGTNECIDNNASFGTVDRATIDDGETDLLKESFWGWPLTIAVTTKYWRPPPQSSSGRRSARAMMKRVNTPILGQYPSNESEASSTLKRQHGVNNNNNNNNGSADITASVHTLTDISEASKTNSTRRSHLGLLVVAGVSFVCFLLTRVCLAAPLLRCFWKTEVHLVLINVIVTVLYLVSWLLLWFGLGVKNAWRFRLLHTTWPYWSRPNPISTASMENGHVTCGPDGLTTIGMSPFQTAYPAMWPYVSYTPWVAPGGQVGINGGLPVAGTNSMHPIPVPLPNVNGIPEGGSGGDSLYGCFTELPQAGSAPPSAGIEQYQSHVSSAGLRAGPPTVSDESEALPEPADGLDGNSRYFKPVPSSISFQNGLASSANYHANTHQSNTPSPFNHVPCESSSRGTSPVDGFVQIVSQNGARQRSLQMAAAHNMLLRQGRNPENGEPTYATLTTLSRPNMVQVRPPSVSPDGRSQTPINSQLHHQTSYRRNGSRVTFKEHEQDENMYRSAQQQQQQQQDGAAGSSDSGVYTNGQGCNSERPAQRGRLKPELFAIYDGQARGPSTAGRGRATTPSGQKRDQPQSYNRTNGRSDQMEMSADLSTSFVVTNGGTATNTHSLYAPGTENVMTRSSDQLCSQV